MALPSLHAQRLKRCDGHMQVIFKSFQEHHNVYYKNYITKYLDYSYISLFFYYLIFSSPNSHFQW